MLPKRNASNAGLVPGRRASSKRNMNYRLARATSYQKITHNGRRVELQIITEVTRDKKFESSTKYETTIRYRVANRSNRFTGATEDLAYLISYGIDKQHPLFREEFLPNGTFKHVGVHGPRNTRDLEDSQKIMLLTHSVLGSHIHPRIGMAEDHKQIFRDSKTYHYLSEFELADSQHRHLGWGPVLMQVWLTSLGNPDNGLNEHAFTGLFLLSPAPMGGELSAEKYLRVVHLLIRQYRKSGYEVFVPGDDTLDGPIYIMGQQFPKRAALPESTMFGPGAFDPDQPDSPLTPPPDGLFEAFEGMPIPDRPRQTSVNDQGKSEDEEPISPNRPRPGGLRLPISSSSEDRKMQDSSEAENSWTARHSNADRKRIGRRILQPDPRRPRHVAQSAESKSIDKYINTNMTQATRSLTMNQAPICGTSILKRGIRPPRPGLDYPWHDRRVYIITPEDDPQWIEEGWRWYNNELAKQHIPVAASNSTPTPDFAPANAPERALASTPLQRPLSVVKERSARTFAAAPQQTRQSRYDVADASGEWPARRILEEGKKQYLIEWEAHPKTGEEFEPSWEPKWYANETLVHAWMASQARR